MTAARVPSLGGASTVQPDILGPASRIFVYRNPHNGGGIPGYLRGVLDGDAYLAYLATPETRTGRKALRSVRADYAPVVPAAVIPLPHDLVNADNWTGHPE